MSIAKATSRMLALDYLRGFFIVVIVIDHLWRWPNLLVIFSGRGELWITAAEGFVIISGLLIGYVRGYKNKALPMKTVTKKLIGRSLLLYLWFVIMTFVYTAFVWYAPNVAAMPWIEITKGDWNQLIPLVLKMQFAHEWIHFLYLYAIFLAISPIVVWMLRKNLAWLTAALSLAIFGLGYVWQIEWMQWQVLFFLPSIAGFYLSTIQKKWGELDQKRRQLAIGGLWSVFAITLIISVIYSPLFNDNDSFDAFNALFAKDQMTIWHVIMAFIWFTGIAMIFEYCLPFIKRWLGWLFEPFGTHSLTAYIIHGIAITVFALIVMDTTSIVINTLIGLACIMITWGLVKSPIVQKFVPR